MLKLHNILDQLLIILLVLGAQLLLLVLDLTLPLNLKLSFLFHTQLKSCFLLTRIRWYLSQIISPHNNKTFPERDVILSVQIDESPLRQLRCLRLRNNLLKCDIDASIPVLVDFFDLQICFFID